MYNKEEQIKVYVMIGTIIMLLVIFSGITYAFFSASNNKGSTSVVEVKSGKMTISYADGKSSLLVSKDIQPSSKIIIDKTFTLTGTNTTSGLAMPYKVGLKYKSTFSDGQLHYYLKRINQNANITSNLIGTANQTIPGNTTETGYTSGTIKKGSKYLDLINGEFKANISNQTITFNLKIQFPDTGENQDSEKGATFNGFLEINRETPIPTTFSDDSWETIATVVKAGEGDAYPVGSQKEVTINNKKYTLRVANNTTPAECSNTNFSKTACGFVVEFTDIVELKEINSTETNVGGWEKSEIRTYLNNSFFLKLPKNLQDAIISTKVISGYGSSDTTNFTTNDKIYLLSAREILTDGKTNYVSSTDSAYNLSRQLDYYSINKVTTENFSLLIKKYDGTNNIWWLRNSSNDNFVYISNSGDWYRNLSPNTKQGISPAFRIG